VICDLLGIPVEDEPEVRRMATEMLARRPGEDDIPQSALDAGKAMRAYFGDLLDGRRRRPRDDLMTLLALAEIDGEPLSPAEAFGMCVILYLAGNTTTSSLISNGLLVLYRHPAQRAALAADLTALPGAVDDLLRFESPVQYTSRVTTRDVELHGQAVPEGSRVMMLVAAANRDPREWDRPDELNLFRPVRRNLAFGKGIHLCIGAPLARLEGRIAFETVLSRMPEYEIAGEVERLYLSTERGSIGCRFDSDRPRSARRG
jgi:cytochrome P450